MRGFPTRSGICCRSQGCQPCLGFPSSLPCRNGKSSCRVVRPPPIRIFWRFAGMNWGLACLRSRRRFSRISGHWSVKSAIPASENQQIRLDFLHRLLKVEHFDDAIRYQLLHRTASALLTAIDFHAATAVMLVHAFDTPADRKIDFTAFCQAMGASEVAPDLFMVPGFTTPSLYLAWCDGNNEYRNVQLGSRL